MCLKIKGCRSDNDCQLDEACHGGFCVRPCDTQPCGTNAVCRNYNHRAVCRCQDGFVGEPTRNCDRPPTPGVCQYNEDCPPNKFCDRLNRVCLSPCMSDTCGRNAECVVENRESRCKCFDGFQGNPFHSCDRRKDLS